eukprot:UN27220
MTSVEVKEEPGNLSETDFIDVEENDAIDKANSLKSYILIFRKTITTRNWFGTIRAFGEFLGPSFIRKPSSRQEAYERLQHNSRHYFTNYVICF